jgi:hypothetical protein
MGVSGGHIVMCIENLSVSFPVYLCKDILGSEVVAHVKVLRYYLCSDDIAALLNSELLPPEVAEVLSKLPTTAHCTKRRSHALIGQDIIKHTGDFSCKDICVLTDLEFFDSTDLKKRLTIIGHMIKIKADSKPPDFEDLESDDFQEADEEEAPLECIDELF